MNIEEVREYCLSLPFVTEDIPFGRFGSDDIAFRVSGKIFAFLLVDDSRMVVLKCDPDKALSLRAQYPDAIEPAFHWNKKYWNQIHYDNPALSHDFICKLILQSLLEVVAKLPKRKQLPYHLCLDHLR